MLAGNPLLAHSIIQAKDSNLFEIIAVSSDSDEILKVAASFGADVLVERPDHLASDVAPKMPSIQHCVREAEMSSGITFDVVVDLDATSPLRSTSDIIGAVELLELHTSGNVITGSPARRSPYFNLVEIDEGGFAVLSKNSDSPPERRQDAPLCYDMNASIYAWWRNELDEGSMVIRHDTRLFEMPEERSVDIDSALDFKIVEMIMNSRQKK